MRETKFLGFDIDEKGIRPSKEKFEAMKNYPVPKNAKGVKKFLGMASYYRKFIPNYSRITEPINRLLKKNCKFIWTVDCENNFRQIKSLLINPPILIYPNFAKKFFVTTDASGVGLGAVLSQVGDDNLEHPICYASRLLNVAEKNYCATELECLGVVWAIDQFRPYVYGRTFKVKCDHNPLVYLNNVKNKSSRLTRWRLSLSEYDFEIEYKKGVLNTNADALSRVGEQQVESETILMVKSVMSIENSDPKVSGSIITRSRSKGRGESPVKENLLKVLYEKPDLLKVNILEKDLMKVTPPNKLPSLSVEPSGGSSLKSGRMKLVVDKLLDKVLPKEMIKAQREDGYTRKIIEDLKIHPSNVYFMRDGMLYKERNFIRSQRFCIVIPFSLRQNVFKMCHDDMGGGHLGMKKTWPKIKERFYWNTMYDDTARWLKSCRLCSMRKTPKVTKIPLGIIDEAEKPFDMIGVDLLGPLPETPRGNKWCCVFSDYNSRWPEAGALKNKKTTSVAKLYVDEVVSRHGGSKILLSDQGGEFMSNLVRDISVYLETSKVSTTAYHPQCNGLTERFNATLCQIISIYADLNQQNWDELLPIVLFAYRTALQESATLSPFEILYNRIPRLPNDLDLLKIENPVVKEFDKNWRLARERVRRAGEKSKKLVKS